MWRGGGGEERRWSSGEEIYERRRGDGRIWRRGEGGVERRWMFRGGRRGEGCLEVGGEKMDEWRWRIGEGRLEVGGEERICSSGEDMEEWRRRKGIFRGWRSGE